MNVKFFLIICVYKRNAKYCKYINKNEILVENPLQRNTESIIASIIVVIPTSHSSLTYNIRSKDKLTKSLGFHPILYYLSSCMH